MTFDSSKHHRRSSRLRGYDYSQPGAYFVTICTQHRKCLFGTIVDGKMVLNDVGQLVSTTWSELPNHYPQVRLDLFVIMPNHFHGILFLIDDKKNNVGAGFKPALPRKSAPAKRYGLSEIIRGFKTFSSRGINEFRNTTGHPLWQRNFFDHIIRKEKELNSIREYILNNPMKWEFDRENPMNSR